MRYRFGEDNWCAGAVLLRSSAGEGQEWVTVRFDEGETIAVEWASESRAAQRKGFHMHWALNQRQRC